MKRLLFLLLLIPVLSFGQSVYTYGGDVVTYSGNIAIKNLLDAVAFNYNGVDQYSIMADNQALNPGNADYSYGCWMKLNAAGAGYILAKNSTANGFFGLYCNTGASVYFNFRTDNAGGTSYPGYTGISADYANWHHYFFVYDYTNHKYYVYTDGVLQNTGGTDFLGDLPQLTSFHEFYLGAGSNSNGVTQGYQPKNCAIKDVQIYKGKALSSTDILTIYGFGAAAGITNRWTCNLVDGTADLIGGLDLVQIGSPITVIFDP